ncbi:AAA family ATPase [Acidisoma cellulosilytica]|uniref:AAA family ATPase n=1 Tax=Acidisoma cellulosilyticum TaxID=2802395 RepID=A0A963Z0A4_9PROT|nr:AAA family ATPase [Acidisoma cellulosilyticum]MCB8880196.1 AAA family ATPase [Acidisoma cellulosilyticum]
MTYDSSRQGADFKRVARHLLPFLPEKSWANFGYGLRQGDSRRAKVNLYSASTKRPETLRSFDSAVERLGMVDPTPKKDYRPEHASGYRVDMVAFRVGPGVVVYDFDKCRDPATGRINREVKSLLEKLDTFAHVSPSGTGIHAIGLIPAEDIQPRLYELELADASPVEIYVGSAMEAETAGANYFSTFVPDPLPGYDKPLRDVTGLTRTLAGESAARLSAKLPTIDRGIALVTDPSTVAESLNRIPNDNLTWNDWSRIGATIYNSTEGSPDGLALFKEWSSKSLKHRDAECDGRWNNWKTHPYTDLSFGSLVHLARLTDPGFLKSAFNDFTGPDPGDDTPPFDTWIEAGIFVVDPGDWDDDSPGPDDAVDDNVPPPDDIDASGATEPVEGFDDAPAPTLAGDLLEADRNTQQAADAASATLQATDCDAVWDMPYTRRWLYGTELINRYVSALGAPGGVGKSAYAMAVALSVATNRSLLNPSSRLPSAHARVHRQGNVWFLGLEDPQGENVLRLKAACQLHGVQRSEIAGRIFLDSGRDRSFVIAKYKDDGSVMVTPLVDQIITEIRRREVRLLIVDPFVNCHELSENANDEMNFVMRSWGKIANDTDCAIWLVHHFRKGGSSGDSEAFRGAVSIQGAARAMTTLTAMTGEDAKRLNVADDERWQYVRSANVKANLAPRQESQQWFRLVPVTLPSVDPEYPEDVSVQAMQAWWPGRQSGTLGWKAAEAMLRTLDGEPMPDERYRRGKRSREVIVAGDTAKHDLWAGSVIMRLAEVNEERAESLLRLWQEQGILFEKDYKTKSTQWNTRRGLHVDWAKVEEQKRRSPHDAAEGAPRDISEFRPTEPHDIEELLADA